MGCIESLLSCCRFLCGGLCGGRRVLDPDFEAEHEVLLENEGNIALAPHEEPEDTGGKQYVVVMRHGERIDEVEEKWDISADRPWDPPLTDFGKLQAATSASELADYHIHLVVTSPFLRCLETSAQILPQLGLNLDHFIVDGGFSEICGARQLNLSGNDFPRGHMLGWMWDGATMEQAVKNFIDSEPALKGVPGKPTVSTARTPTPIEPINSAMHRYASALERIAAAYPRKNILVVTHGEALRVSVNRVNPDVIVYETRHVGFTVTGRDLPKHGGQGRDVGEQSPWELLSESGAHGVNWM